MAKLIATIGLPGSGKSFWAKQQANKIPMTKTVCKDDLRAMMDKSWSKANEKFVLKIRDYIIKEALKDNYNIIVHDTNLHPKHIETFRNIAKEFNADFEIKDFIDVPLATCIKQDLNRTTSVGKDVIMQMYNQYLKPKSQVYTPPEGKPRAIIVDLDGTLAHMTTRTRFGKQAPYMWQYVGEDEVDHEIAELIRIYYWFASTAILAIGIMDEDVPIEPKIILLSGRDSVCRPETEQWLKDNNVPYDELFMREEGNNEKDSIIKERLFNNHIKDNYQVMFILDDRKQVVDQWRSMGLKCFQVAEGEF